MSRTLYAVAMAAEVPKYQQVADDLRARIEAGEFQPGDALPSKPRLMTHYGVAQHTLDHAIEVLRRDGYADPQRGKGVYVLSPPDPGPSDFDILMTQIEELRGEIAMLRTFTEGLEAKLSAMYSSHGGPCPQGGTGAGRGRQAGGS